MMEQITNIQKVLIYITCGPLPHGSLKLNQKKTLTPPVFYFRPSTIFFKIDESTMFLLLLTNFQENICCPFRLSRTKESNQKKLKSRKYVKK